MLKKYTLSIIIIVSVFTAGFFTGCNKPQMLSPGASAARTEHTKTVVPAALAGVHSVPSTGTTEVAFSPEGGITGMVVKEISTAKKNIQVQAYSFTSQEIIQALIDAKKRGVDVRIIIDKSNAEEGSGKREEKERNVLQSIVAAGIPLKVDYDFQIAHSKVMIIDGADVITGSFNFTHAAEHNNAENCLVIHDNKPLADLYLQNWQWRWDATDLYKGK